MRIIRLKTVSVLFLVCIFAALVSCATVNTRDGLSPNELAYYNDSFDIMRQDLWDRRGSLYRDEQVKNFIHADQDFADGLLIIRTETGSFSKGGMSSRFYTRGDFDIQLDCRMEFKYGNLYMDQIFSFAVLDKTSKPQKSSFVSIGLALPGGGDSGILFSHCVLNGRRKKGFMQQIGNFKGSLRIVRNGEFISTSYKEAGSPGWNRMDSFQLNKNDMLVGFQLRNFFDKRTAIVATDSVSAEIDHFRINTAGGIIEVDN